jgi:hypothetical protein
MIKRTDSNPYTSVALETTVAAEAHLAEGFSLFEEQILKKGTHVYRHCSEEKEGATLQPGHKTLPERMYS